jgi:endonuclease III-like uncharacterized protein
METLPENATHPRFGEPRSQFHSVANVVQPTPNEYYNSILSAFGSQPWRPGKTTLGEAIMGASPTQAASWANCEAAMANVRTAGLLSPPVVEQVSLRRLEGEEGRRA